MINTATKNLEADHVYILRLIDVMEKMMVSKNTSKSHMETVVYLIKTYADGIHHAKEENLLFPMMIKKGFSKEQGPVSVMLHEHVLGRNFVKGMTLGIAGLNEGNPNGIHLIYENIQGYITLLRSHISKENNALFKMADNILTEEDHQELLHEFSRIEKNNICGGVLSNCIESIENLEKEFKN